MLEDPDDPPSVRSPDPGDDHLVALGVIAVEHLLLGAVGLVAGWLFAVAVAPSLGIGVTEVLEPGGRKLATGSLSTGALGVVVIIVSATVLPAVRVGCLTTAAALNPPVIGRGRSRLARLAGNVGRGPVVVGGMKDAFGRPVRTVLAALSIALAVIALLVTLGLDHTVAEVAGNPALTGDPWDVTITPPPDLDSTKLTDAIDATPGVAGLFFESEGRRVVEGQVVLARAVGGDPGSAGYVVRAGRAMTSAGEAMAA